MTSPGKKASRKVCMSEEASDVDVSRKPSVLEYAWKIYSTATKRLHKN
jgi:hypothetical protein